MEKKEKEVKEEIKKELPKEEPKKEEKAEVKTENNDKGKNKKTTIIIVAVLGGLVAILLGYVVFAKVIFKDNGSSSSSSSSSSTTNTKVNGGEVAGGTTATTGDTATCTDATATNATTGGTATTSNATATNATASNATATNASSQTAQSNLADKSKGMVYLDTTLSDEKYNVPVINFNSEDVNAINNDIKNIVSSLRQDSKNNGLDYFTTVNDYVLSLVLVEKHGNSTNFTYRAYMISTTTLKTFTSDMAMNRVGLTLDQVKETAYNVFFDNPKFDNADKIQTKLAFNDAPVSLTNRVYLNSNNELILIFEEFDSDGHSLSLTDLINVSKGSCE